MGGSWPGAGGRHGGDTFFSFLDAGSHILIGPLALSSGGRGTDPRTRCLLRLRHRRGYVSGTPSGPGRAHESLVGVHVGLNLVAYAAFAVAFSMSLLYVVQEDILKKRYQGVRRLVLGLVVALGTGLGTYVGYLMADPTIFEDYTGHRVYGYSQGDWLLIGLGAGTGLVVSLIAGWAAARGAARPSFANRLPALYVLDQLSSRSIVLGFVLLGTGILSGALWAQSVWGSWWVWDPKEVWALVAWLFYGAYLVFRNLANWRGRYAAFLAIAGLFFIVLAFLGVNLFFPGRHDFN